MRKLLLGVFCFLFLASISFGQSNDVEKIKKILSAQVANWNNGNIDQFMNGYWQSDSLVFMGKSGVTKGYNATLESYKKRYPDLATMGKLNFKISKIDRLDKKIYLVIGAWHLERKAVGDVGGFFSLIFKKFGNDWKIVLDHTS